jgi:ribosomal protein L37E
LQHVENAREDARILYHQGDNEEAIELLEGWLRQHPDDAAGWEIIAAAYFNLRRYPEAEAAAGRAVELWPDSARAWSNWGTMLRKLGRHDEARGAQQRARRLDPYYQRPHIELAKLPPGRPVHPQPPAARREPPPSFEEEQAAARLTDGEEFLEQAASFAPPSGEYDAAEQERCEMPPLSAAALPTSVPALPGLPASAAAAPFTGPEPAAAEAGSHPPTERPPATPLQTTVCRRCGHTVPAQTYCVHCGRPLDDAAVSHRDTPAQRRLKTAWYIVMGVLLVLLGLLLWIKAARADEALSTCMRCLPR